MTVLLVAIWYICGLIGCGLAAYVDNQKGEDITLADLLLMLIFSGFGIFIMLIGVIYFFKKNPIVLIKGVK